jgi:hypothetical protein
MRAIAAGTTMAATINITNHSIFLPEWDLLFGTYYMPAERRPSVYGVVPPLPTGLVDNSSIPCVAYGAGRIGR